MHVYRKGFRWFLWGCSRCDWDTNHRKRPMRSITSLPPPLATILALAAPAVRSANAHRTSPPCSASYASDLVLPYRLSTRLPAVANAPPPGFPAPPSLHLYPAVDFSNPDTPLLPEIDRRREEEEEKLHGFTCNE